MKLLQGKGEEEMRLIDAEFVKKKMQEIMDYQDAYLPIHFEGILDDAPTVDAEPIRHGHWVSRIKIYECSECGFAGYPEMNYCPWCGAKMDEVEE